MLTDEERVESLHPPDLQAVSDFIKEAFQTKDKLRVRDDRETVWRLYICLSKSANHIVSRPDKYRDLIQSIYTFDWNMDRQVVLAFINLIGHMVSSNPIFLIPTLQVLVKSMAPIPTSRITTGAGDQIPSEEDSNAMAAAAERREHLHRTIGNVVRIAPTALFELFPVLSDFFPHKRHPLHVHTEYVSQLLHLCEAFPSLQQKVVDLILRRGLEMDVDIVIEDSGEAKMNLVDEAEGDAGGLFQLDDNDMVLGLEAPTRQRQGISSSATVLSQQLGGIGSGGVALKICDDAAVVETADKLDAVLVLLLEFIRRRAGQWGITPAMHSSDSVGTSGDGRAAFNRDNGSNGKTADGKSQWKKLFFQLLDAFEVRVMTTYKAKFVQFAVFHMCQLDPSLDLAAVMLCRRLFELFIDPSNHPLCRQSAVVYLASLLARATFITFGTAREYVCLMVHWAHTYVSFRGNERAMVPTIKMLADRAARYTTAAVAEASAAPLAASVGGDVSAVPVETGAGADYSTYGDQHYQGVVSAGGGGSDCDGLCVDDDDDGGDWYMDEWGRRVPRADSDLSRHETFYCCVQSACYSLCFYGLPMAETIFTSHSRHMQVRQHWQTVLTCAYNPLRYCLHSVRHEFLRVVHAMDPTLFHTIDTAVGRGGLRALLQHSSASTVTTGPSTAGVNPLDTFFPFDPCLLSRVHGYVHSGYRVWQGAPPGLCSTAGGVDDFDDFFDENVSCRREGGTDIVDDGDYDDEESESVVSSMASSIASMALLGTRGNSVTGIAAGAGYLAGSYPAAESYTSGSYLETSTMAMSYGAPSTAAAAVGSSTRKSGPYSPHVSAMSSTQHLNYVGVGVVSGSVHSNSSGNVDAVDEDQWSSILRTKRSRQYSVGSAGSW